MLQKMATSIEALKSFQANTMLKFFIRATEKTKRSWTYREKTEWIRRICYFIEASVWSLASPEHPKKCGGKMLKKVRSYTVDFTRFRTISDNPT